MYSVAPAVLPPVFLCRQISFRNIGGKTAGATGPLAKM